MTAPDVPKSFQSVIEHHKALQSALEHHKAGRLSEAKFICRQLLQAKPDHHKALHLLGLIASQEGEYNSAVELMNRSVQASPSNSVYYYNLGSVYNTLNKPDEAIACYRKALEFRPDDTETLNNLGNTFRNQGRLDEAIACYQKALALRSDDATALNNLGIALKGQHKLDEAIACYRKALALRPGEAGFLKNLGNVLKEQGMTEEAMACYRESLAIRPDDTKAHDSKLLAAHYASLYTPAEMFAEHLKFAEQFEAPLKSSWRPHPNPRDPEKRLKVGYVSPDFRIHSVAYFVEPVLANHDESQVEVFCYYIHNHHDGLTDRFISEADHWVPCAEMPDDRLADRIRADGIDILVDLAGHTGENRLLVFARKPAPAQVTYLGYPNTTGLSAMDYRLTDALSDPPGQEMFYTEKLVRLPEGFLCYRPPADSPPVSPLPAPVAGHVTFGSFNNLTKINEKVVALWADLLKHIGNARLLIKNSSLDDPATRERYRRLFEERGVRPERLELLGHIPSLTEHLALYARLDIALDTFPYNGTTTTCEALWMGVPVITLAGERHAGRVGVSLLNSVGLLDWIAETQEQYIALAAKMAADIPHLAGLRAGLRQRVAASPLCDGPAFARKVEAAYREMWRAWCAGTA